MAESWASEAAQRPRIFCRFNEREFRWGSTSVKRDGAVFVVHQGVQWQNLDSIEGVAAALGTPEHYLSRWLALAREMRFYCIEDAAFGTIQILLEGSDWSPYGFRYALKDKPDGLGVLEQAVKDGGVGLDRSDTRMERVFGRWFYFEARR